LPKEHPEEWKAAIKRLYELDLDVMLPGHGSPTMPKDSEQVKAFYQGLN